MAPRLPSLLSGLADRLAVRILLLLSLALLPLGMIAVHTTAEVLRTARQGSERALISMTADAVAGRRALIESALASTRALGPLAYERLEDVTGCSAFLAEYVARSGVFTFAGFIERNGQLRCASMGGPFDLSDNPIFRELERRPTTTITATAAGVASGLPVLIVVEPIFTDDALVGYQVISISQQSVQMMAGVTMEQAPRRVVLFNHAGALVSLNPAIQDIASGDLPARVNLADLVGGGSRVFSDLDGEGRRATFGVAELLPNRLYALGTWPEGAAGPAGWRTIVVPMLFPILMWLASLAVLYFAIFHLVIRHVRTLNRQMRRFALGHRDAEAELPRSAPHEFRELSGTFRKMTWIIARDEAAREADLAEKTVLLKEVHHRVKNNLQLIASILNLQMRQLRDAGARGVLQSVQDRVLGLATIHRSLYEDAQLSKLRADRVLHDILRQVLSMGVPPGSGIEVKIDLAPLTTDPDQVVPLTLLLTEAVTNALKHIGQAGRHPPWLDIRLRVEAGHAELTVANSTAAQLPGEGETRLGSELIAAFAMQLGGEVESGAYEESRGPGYRLTLRFPAEQDADAPPRRVPAPATKEAV